jgi:predicted acyl esterase
MFGRSMALPRWRWMLAALAALVVLAIAPMAQAAPPTKVLGAVNCAPTTGGITECNGQTLSFDGTKIDVNVFLPPESLGAGPFPVIGDFHGWGGSKQGLKTFEPEPGTGLTFEQEDPRIQHWAEDGYAVFSMSDRGWGLSCGKFDPGKGLANCANGYNHLMDDRYEVRDAQFLISELADEGLVQPNKVGATGASYGGGISAALAALRNRVMLPNGALAPWESPEGLHMEIAAAVPQWPWTDIAYALAPNGRNLDYVTNSPYRGPTGKLPIGVWKASWSEGLNTVGEAISNYSKTDQEANIAGWLLRFKAGDPYTDATIEGIVKLLSTFHSSFGINPSVEPSPLLIQSGWNDDLFPVDEALRLYQRTRAQYPNDPISLYFTDMGHSRSTLKTPIDEAAFNERLEAWFAHYLKGEGASPSSSVETVTTVCGGATPTRLKAANWSSLAPGEIRLQSSGPQTITHTPNSEEEGLPTTSSGAFDPILGTKDACTALPAAAVKNEHSAEYSLAPAPAGGYTLMGSPTIIADIQSPSPNSEIAARLLDVSPEGNESLVARGVYRPVGGSQQMVFQLHAQGYQFAPGHVAKLELLPSDFPYVRYSNLQANVIVNSLELRLPVTDQPGALDGLVQSPAPKVVPPGYTLATEYEQKATPPSPPAPGPPAPKPVNPPKVGFAGIAGKLTANGKAVIVPVRCSSDGACTGSLSFWTKKTKEKASTALARGNYSLATSTATNVKVPLTKAGKKLVKNEIAANKKKLSGVLQLQDVGRANTLTLNRAAQLPRGK